MIKYKLLNYVVLYNIVVAMIYFKYSRYYLFQLLQYTY